MAKKWKKAEQKAETKSAEKDAMPKKKPAGSLMKRMYGKGK